MDWGFFSELDTHFVIIKYKVNKSMVEYRDKAKLA